MQLSQCHSNVIASSDLELQDPRRLDKRVRIFSGEWKKQMPKHGGFEWFESNNFQGLLSFDIKGTTTGITAKTTPAKTGRSHDKYWPVFFWHHVPFRGSVDSSTESTYWTFPWQGNLMSSCPAMTRPPIRETMMPRRATKAALVAWPSPKLFAMRMPTLSPIAMANRNDKIKIFITSKSWVSAQNCEFQPSDNYQLLEVISQKFHGNFIKRNIKKFHLPSTFVGSSWASSDRLQQMLQPRDQVKCSCFSRSNLTRHESANLQKKTARLHKKNKQYNILYTYS